MPRVKRRRFLVNDFQFSLLKYGAAYFAAISLVVYIFGLNPLIRDLQDPSLSASERQTSALVFMHFHERLLPVIIPLTLVLAGHLVFLSHRIAGPIYRFAATFRAIEGGDLTVNASVREKDYLRTEAALLSRAIETLNGRIAALKEQTGSLLETSASLKTCLFEEDRGSARSKAEALAEELHHLREALAHFETKEVEETLHATLLDELPSIKHSTDGAEVANRKDDAA